MSVQFRGRLARLVGVPLLGIGVLLGAGNLLSLAVQHRYGLRYTVAAPLLVLLGLAMTIFPGRGPVESNVGGPPGAFARMLRGLGAKEIAAWVSAIVVGVALGIAWLCALAGRP